MAYGILVPPPGRLNPCPLLWKGGALMTGPPRKSWRDLIFFMVRSRLRSQLQTPTVSFGKGRITQRESPITTPRAQDQALINELAWFTNYSVQLYPPFLSESVYCSCPVLTSFCVLGLGRRITCLFSSQILKSQGRVPKHPHLRGLLHSRPVKALPLEPKPHESHSWMRLWGS